MLLIFTNIGEKYYKLVELHMKILLSDMYEHLSVREYLTPGLEAN